MRPVITLGKKNFEVEKNKNLKLGIEKQREIFKQAKLLGLKKQMADSIENIKSDIKAISIKNGGKKDIQKIEKILLWYNNLDNIYATKTPEGIKVVYPMNIEDKINRFLTFAYEICMQQLDKLDLL